MIVAKIQLNVVSEGRDSREVIWIAFQKGRQYDQDNKVQDVLRVILRV